MMGEIIKQLTVPAIFSVIIITVIYCLNIANEYIIKPIGITKYGKKYAISILIIIIGITIICMLTIVILYNCIHSQITTNINVFLKTTLEDKKHIYLVYICSIIFFLITSILNSSRFEKNKLKFINRSENKLGFYKICPFLVLIIMSFIDNILLFMSFYYNDKNIYIMAIMVYVYNIICSIVIYSFMNAKLQLLSLKNVIIELKSNRYFSNSKIIYQNDIYTCIYYDQQIIYINTPEILLIQEEKSN